MVDIIVLPIGENEDRECGHAVMTTTEGREYYLVPKIEFEDLGMQPLPREEWIPLSDIDVVRIEHTKTLLIVKMPGGRYLN